MKLSHYTTTGVKSEIALPAFMTGEANQTVLAQAIRVYLSNARQGTSKTKTRSEINRTKKKWFKQKGTGNARHGARTPSIFVGGGVSHGPNGEQNWLRSLPQRSKHQALVSALIAQADNVIDHEGLADLKGKTKAAATLVSSMVPAKSKVLVIIDQTRPEVVRGLQNIETVLVMTAGRVTALEVASADKILVTSEALKVLEQRVAASVSQTDVVEKPAAKVVTKVAPVKKVAAEKPVAKKAVATKKAAKPKVKAAK